MDYAFNGKRLHIITYLGLSDFEAEADTFSGS